MGSWQKRGCLYKVGFMGVMLGSLVFVVSFCSPTWAQYKSQRVTQNMGLWQTCVEDLSLCTVAVDSDNPGWLKAVRALESIAMFFAVAACIVGTYCNCIIKNRQSPEFFNKNMETSAIVSVIFGTFGLIIFATQAGRLHSDMVGEIYWGFVVACVADCLLGLGAFSMLASRKLQLMALNDYFAHRQFRDSFHTDVQFPDYTAGAIIPDMAADHLYPGRVEFEPPSYETVVNCGVPSEVSPPPYSQVVSEDKDEQLGT